MVCVFALLVVSVLGSVTHGSKISYSINGFTFQPSEFVKILFVFFIAGLLTESKSLGQVVISAVAAAAHVIILVFSKDLGSAVIFFAGYLIAGAATGWIIWSALENATFFIEQTRKRCDFLCLNGIEYMLYPFITIGVFSILCALFHAVYAIISLLCSCNKKDHVL